MSHEERQDPSGRDGEIQRAMGLEILELARKRTRWIMIMGSIFSFVMFPVGILAASVARDILGDIGALVAILSLPLGLGSLIAFLGMTMTDHRRNVAEWGVFRPGACLGYGMLPFLLTIVYPPALAVVVVVGLGAWLLMILGAWITAEIIERSLTREL